MAAKASLPSAFPASLLPESLEILYREMVELGGGRYVGFAPGSKSYPDLIVFEDGNQSHRGFLMVLPALHITADGVRSAIRKLGAR